MDWAAPLGPAYTATRAEVRRLRVGEEGTLSVKVKGLVVMGVLAARGLQYGVAAHMRRAIDYGATKEELFEAMKAAAVWGSGRSRLWSRTGLSRRSALLRHRAAGGVKPPPSPALPHLQPADGGTPVMR
jgi:alkylhydroperoxidase/carboxymuconolactone decarboxylase family protein YurZ